MIGRRLPILFTPRSCYEMNMSMSRFLLTYSLSILLTLGLSACNDPTPAAPTGGTDGGTLPPITGTGGTGGGSGAGGDAGAGGAAGRGGSGGSAGQGGSGGDAGAGGQGGSGGVVELGACTGDFAEVASLQPGHARTLAASVTVSDQFANEFPNRALFDQCVIDGMQVVLTELSTECATCYAALAWCSLPNCNISCQNDSCLPICLTCPDYDTCREDLNRCTGTTPTECTGT